MSQNSKWSSWQQLKQETIIIEAPINTVSLIVEDVTPVEEPTIEAIDEQPTEEITPKSKKRNVNV